MARCDDSRHLWMFSQTVLYFSPRKVTGNTGRRLQGGADKTAVTNNTTSLLWSLLFTNDSAPVAGPFGVSF